MPDGAGPVLAGKWICGIQAGKASGRKLRRRWSGQLFICGAADETAEV